MRHKFNSIILLPTRYRVNHFSKKINWDRTESNDGWEFGGDWEHNFNKK